MNNQPGKTLTIIAALIVVLLISSTAIGFFMYQQESQIRRSLESQLAESRQLQEKTSNELKDTKKQLTLLEDKNKEADAKINSLMDEIELNKGLHNALKKENSSLKESLDTAKKDREALRIELENAAKKLQENLDILKAEQDKTRQLQDKINDLQKPKDVSAQAVEVVKDKMELGKIVINSEQDSLKGQILSVDKDTEFIVCSLGAKQGVKVGDTLAVYRGDQYVGAVKVTRAQDEMSAADFIAPLSSRDVRKTDIVVPKQS